MFFQKEAVEKEARSCAQHSGVKFVHVCPESLEIDVSPDAYKEYSGNTREDKLVITNFFRKNVSIDDERGDKTSTGIYFHDPDGYTIEIYFVNES